VKVRQTKLVTNILDQLVASEVKINPELNGSLHPKIVQESAAEHHEQINQ